MNVGLVTSTLPRVRDEIASQKVQLAHSNCAEFPSYDGSISSSQNKSGVPPENHVGFVSGMSAARSAHAEASASGDLFWSVLANGAQVLSALASLMLLAPSLGREVFGAYIAAQAMATILLPIVSFGPGAALIHRIIREKADPRETFEQISTLQAMAVSVAFVGASVLGWLLIPRLSVLELLLIFVGELVVGALIGAASSSFSAMHSIARAKKLLFAVGLGRVLNIAGLALVGELSVLTLAAMTLLTSLLVAVRTVPRALRLYAGVVRPQRVGGDVARITGRFALPMLMNTARSHSQQLVFAGNGMLGASAEFGIANRVVGLALLPQSSLLDAFDQRLLETRGARVPLYKRVNAGSLVLGVVGAAVVLAGAGLIPMFAGEEFREAVTITRWLAVLIVLRSLTTPQQTRLVALNRSDLRAVISVVVGVFVATYVVLIPRLGWSGAVVAWVAAEIVELVILLTVNARVAGSQADQLPDVSLVP